METVEQIQLANFKAAKQIAITIRRGCYRRAAGSNYVGFKSADGKMYVIGDTASDIPSPDCYIDDKPAREIFGDFTVMSK